MKTRMEKRTTTTKKRTRSTIPMTKWMTTRTCHWRNQGNAKLVTNVATSSLLIKKYWTLRSWTAKIVSRLHLVENAALDVTILTTSQTFFAAKLATRKIVKRAVNIMRKGASVPYVNFTFAQTKNAPTLVIANAVMPVSVLIAGRWHGAIDVTMLTAALIATWTRTMAFIVTSATIYFAMNARITMFVGNVATSSVPLASQTSFVNLAMKSIASPVEGTTVARSATNGSVLNVLSNAASVRLWLVQAALNRMHALIAGRRFAPIVTMSSRAAAATKRANSKLWNKFAPSICIFVCVDERQRAEKIQRYEPDRKGTRRYFGCCSLTYWCPTHEWYRVFWIRSGQLASKTKK